MRNSWLLAVSALALGASGAHAAPPKPCDVISIQQAQTLLGPGVQTTDESSGEMMQCTYISRTNKMTLTYAPVAISGGADIVKQALQLRSDAESIREPLSGLGDMATYISTKGGSSEVDAMAHGLLIQVVYNQPGPSSVKQSLIDLARQVVGKL